MARHFGLTPKSVRLEPVKSLQLVFSDVGFILFLAAIYLGAGIGIIIYAATVARSRDNHDQHHAQYQNWLSNEGFNCCNDKDCGTLADSRVREVAGHIEVLVFDNLGDEWCPVELRHLVDQKKGKRQSPDWSRDHACIVDFASGGVCAKLKCFMEKGKF